MLPLLHVPEVVGVSGLELDGSHGLSLPTLATSPETDASSDDLQNGMSDITIPAPRMTMMTTSTHFSSGMLPPHEIQH